MSGWQAIPEVGVRIEALSRIKGLALEIQRCLTHDGDAMECAKHIVVEANRLQDIEVRRLWVYLGDALNNTTAEAMKP